MPKRGWDRDAHCPGSTLWHLQSGRSKCRLRTESGQKICPGWFFFDRGLIDAAATLEYATGKPVLKSYATARYNKLVFMTPPWPEIYVGDDDRQHGLEEAVNEYERLLTAFLSLGYDIQLLPRVAVNSRADFIMERLGLA
ncbi:AAA family ATPase [Sphingomonas sp. C3-2]|uniref:AAA family ATPase n=1 Tax=Sphingomonas sp. C3-2 TaxID=3062169 RepID=UPI00294AA679|nr:AAA family ATPase [Sphingomonas sp. C3-2]WOK36797.1 AAA family ATPase [Sphingomonas sp. C3-2]